MILDELLVIGEWWFSNSNIRFSGKLSFNFKDGGKLTIFGSEEPFMRLDTSGTPSQQAEESGESDRVCKRKKETTLLLGNSTNGEKITVLVSSTPIHKSVRREYYSYCEREFKIDFIFLGIHFEKVEDIKFEDVLVEYSDLSNWLSDHELIGSTYSCKSENKYVVEYYYGKISDINIDNICSIQILSRPDITIRFGEENKICNHTYVRIHSVGQRTLEEYIMLKRIFQDFLNFVILDKVVTLKFVGSVKLQESNHHIVKETQIFYQSSISQNMDKIEVRSPYLLIYENLGERLNHVIELWFHLRKKIPAVYDLYFGVMYNSELYLSNKFLMLAEAVAIYVQFISKKNLDSKLEEKSKRVDNICEILDKCLLNEDDKQWVRSIMQDKRFLSFKESMEKIYDLYYELLSQLSKVIGQKEEFSSRITELRHSLIHGNFDYDKLDTEEFIWNYKDLQLILQLCVLSELGFSENEIKDIYFIKWK